MKISSSSSLSPSPMLFYPSVLPLLQSLSMTSVVFQIVKSISLGSETLTRLHALWKVPSWCPVFTACSPHSLCVRCRCSLASRSSGRSWAITFPRKHLFTPLLPSICSPGSQSILPNRTKINTNVWQPDSFLYPSLPSCPSITHLQSSICASLTSMKTFAVRVFSFNNTINFPVYFGCIPWLDWCFSFRRNGQSWVHSHVRRRFTSAGAALSVYMTADLSVPLVATVFIVTKAVSYHCAVSISLLHSTSNSLQLPPSPVCLNAFWCLSSLSQSHTADILVPSENTRGNLSVSFSVLCPHCTLVNQSNASNGRCWPCVRVWSRARARYLTGCMIDATFRLRQIVHINLAGQKAFKHSGIHELTRLSAFITGGRIAISNHWTHAHRSTRTHKQP